MFVIAPIPDVFDVLERFDIALIHDQRLNVDSHTLVLHTKPIPPAFPQYNGGFVGIRKSETTSTFLCHWQEEFDASHLKIDQPVLRELLFDSELRIATIPLQYNVLDVDLIRALDSRTMAPRVIHSSRIHLKRTKSGKLIQSLEDLVGLDFEKHLGEWQLRDETLNANRPVTRTEAYCDKFPRTLVHPDAVAFAGKTGQGRIQNALQRIGSFAKWIN